MSVSTQLLSSRYKYVKLRCQSTSLYRGTQKTVELKEDCWTQVMILNTPLNDTENVEATVKTTCLVTASNLHKIPSMSSSYSQGVWITLYLEIFLVLKCYFTCNHSFVNYKNIAFKFLLYWWIFLHWKKRF